MTITRRILGQVALATALVIAVGTAVAYRLVLHATEQQGVTHLSDYVKERALAEQRGLNLVEQNLDLTRALFLQRDAVPPPADLERRWHERNEFCPDGAWRTRRAASDGTNSATMWIRKDAPLTPELQARIACSEAVLNDLLLGWRDTFVSLYFIFPEQVNIGFDMRISQWIWDAKADYDTCGPYFFSQATPQNNPARQTIWSKSGREPVSQKPYVSVTTPIYRGDRFLGIVGHDIALGDLLANTARSGIPDATHYLFRRDGQLIANPAFEQRILDSEGSFSLQASGDPGLQALYAAVTNRSEAHFTGYLPENNSYFAASVLHGPEWFLVTLMPQASLRAQALRSAQAVLWSGLIMLALVLAGFALILRRQVARPLAELAAATSRVSAGDTRLQLEPKRDDELGRLGSAFNLMARNIAERDAALRQEKNLLEQRVAERTAELTTSEARIRTMLENAPEAIVVLDGQTGRFVDANENALRFFELDRARLLQAGPAQLSPARQPDGRPSEELAREKIQAALQGGTPVFAWTHRNTSGAEIPCEVRLSRLPAAGRELVIGTILDITDRKQAEEQLLKALARERELSQLKSEFVSMVSHEFRTPLNIIVSSSDILSRYLERLTPEERADHLAAIQAAVKRMAGMMEDVLLLGRFDGEQQRFQPDDLHLVSFCRRFADEMRSAVADRCPLQLELDDTLPLARVDENLLRHILANLISNAVKYSPANAPVTVTLRREGRDAVLQVTDRGLGIPTADQPLLFAAFHRGRNTGQIPGTGLGLVIVKRSVDLHGGIISFTSAEDEGTTFTVRLPVFD